jgi:hypothetical protein
MRSLHFELLASWWKTPVPNMFAARTVENISVVCR